MSKDDLVKRQKENRVATSNSVGARYPVVGFVTNGYGVSSLGHPPHPYETFAFDEALLMAKIQDYNIVPYSSVLPEDIQLVGLEDAQPYFYHGAVLEVIMAGIGATYSAAPAKRNIGIRSHSQNYILDSDTPVMAIASCLGQLTNVTDKQNNKVGGYMAEYVGVFETHVGESAAEAAAEKQLNESLDNILTIRGYSKDSGVRKIYNTTYAEVTEDKKYGYALSAMGFISFSNAPPYPS